MAARGFLRVLGAMSMVLSLGSCLASTDTITWGGDNSRAGYQPNKNMDPAVVASSDFGQIFQIKLPGNYGGEREEFFSMPLVYTPGNDENGRQFLYLATTQNNVYKLDAKTGEILARTNLGIPFLSRDLNTTGLGFCYDISPHVGIIGTGVIDPATDTLYIAAKTYSDQSRLYEPQGRPSGRYNIHALDVNTLESRPNFPINFEGQDARNNVGRPFNGGMHNQRPGMLHPAGSQFVYVAFGSHCVLYNFTGRIIGFDKTSGKLVEHFATLGQDVRSPTKGAGIWMSGGGLASDDKGSMFYATGNGYASQLHDIPVSGRSPPTALDEAVVHHTILEDGKLNVVDFFMPEEKEELDGADNDLGTSPFELLPSQFSCGSVRRIGVVTGKTGWTYFLNLDDLGGYRTKTPFPQPKGSRDRILGKILQLNSVYAGAGVYPGEGGYIYIPVINNPTTVIKFTCSNGVPSFAKVGETPERNGGILGISHGTVTSLNGQPGTGLLWTTDVRSDFPSGASIKVHEAIPGPDGKLKLIKGFKLNDIKKFTRAVLGNGILYVPSQGTITAYGAPTSSPLNCTGAGSFGKIDVGVEAPEKTITCEAKIATTVNSATLSSTEYSVVGVPRLPATVAAGDKFTFKVHYKATKVGDSTGTIVLGTTNSAGGYSKTTSVRVSGTAESSGPLLFVQPSNIIFSQVPLGAGPTFQSVIISNLGKAALAIQSTQFSLVGPQGPFVDPTTTPGQTGSNDTAGTAGTSKIGHFTFSNLPSTSMDPESQQAVSVIFDPTEIGNFTAYCVMTTSGGNAVISVTASTGAAPVAVLEWEKADGSGWVTWDKTSSLTFGNVLQNTEKGLKLRLRNGAPPGSLPLRITISKPPFGVGGIISTRTASELGEGISLDPGEVSEANMFCAPPKAQWNTDSYTGKVAWTFNFNDLSLGKVDVPFDCKAIAQQGGPLNSDSQGVYRYIGCFRENNPSRQLAQQLGADNAMTSNMCLQLCATKNYAYCGIQYHRECWGGPTIPKLKVLEGNCNFDCSGDIGQMCGGNGVNDGAGNAHLSMWATNTTIPPNPPANPSTTTSAVSSPTNTPVNPGGPYINSGVNGYKYIGCYSETPGGRSLSSGNTGDVRTVAGCVSTCKAKGFKYIALQYFGECWCGNNEFTQSPGVGLVADSQCNSLCRDNQTEYCGAGARNQVYQLETTLPISNSSSTSASSTSSSSTASSATTSTSSSSTALSTTSTDTTSSLSAVTTDLSSTTTGSSTSSTSATPTSSSSISTDSSTSNTLTSTAASTATDSSTSTSSSTGASTSTSASASSTSDVSSTSSTSTTDVSSSTTSTSTSSTASDSTASTTTSATSSSSSTSDATTSTSSTSSSASSTATSSSTSSSSTSSSSSASSTSLASTTSSTSPSVTSGSTASSSTSSTSSTSTASSTSASTTSSSISSSSTSSTSSTSTTSSATPSSTVTPPLYPGNSNFSYYGCVSEPSSGRLFAKQIANLADMTQDKCLQACWMFKFAGIEYGRECWCGDVVNFKGNGGGTPGANVSESQCSFNCPGDATGKTKCGAGVRMNLFYRDPAKATPGKRSAPLF
ncbi:hypothetical protein RB598_007400 [Gaeumannomyces tritici]